MRESKYQRELVKRLKDQFPGCKVFKGDPSREQGTPDLLLLYGTYWAGLEVKESATAPFRPNQEYRIAEMDNMSFAHVIFPENEAEVIRALQATFGLAR